MSGLVDQYGNPLVLDRKFVKAAEYRADKPYQRLHIGDIDTLVPSHDWKAVLSASRKLFMNMGIVKAAVVQKAAYSVGRAWNPIFKGKNKKWGDKITDWLINDFYPICSVRGSMYDFKSELYVDSISVDRDGDFFILLTESKEGFPQFQRIGAHRIGQRYSSSDKVDKGPYRGLRICNGVIFNKIGRPVAYRVLGETMEEDEDISSRDLIHVFDPNWHEQGRGLPSGTHALDELISSLKSHEYEQMAQLMLSCYGIIEHNEYGMPDPSDPRNLATADGAIDGTGVTTQTQLGGLIKYFKANTGGKLESIKQDRPGNVWESFQDRIARSYITGMNWSYSFVWKAGELNGTNQRAELEKVKRSIEDRQDLQRLYSKKLITFAIAKAVKLGMFQPDEEWYKWDFTMPPKISIDRGDEKIQVDSWRAGSKNLTEILSERGRTFDEHTRERAVEVAKRKLIKKEVEEEYDVSIDDREMVMLTENETPEDKEEKSDKED